MSLMSESEEKKESPVITKEEIEERLEESGMKEVIQELKEKLKKEE